MKRIVCLAVFLSSMADAAQAQLPSPQFTTQPITDSSTYAATTGYVKSVLQNSPAITSPTITGGTLGGLTLNNATITNSTINSTTIGASQPSTGAFTTLTTTAGANFATLSTAQGGFNVGTNSTAQQLQINGPAGANRNIRWSTANSARWQASLNSTSESGSNAGSDLDFISFADNGSTLINPAFRLTRATGAGQFYHGLTVNSGLTVTGGLLSDTFGTTGTTYTLSGSSSTPTLIGMTGLNLAGSSTTAGAPIQLNIGGDTVAAHGASGQLPVVVLTHNFGGGSTSGDREGVRVLLNQSGAVSETIGSPPSYTTMEVWSQFSNTAGGNGIGVGHSNGYIYGMNPQTVLYPGAQWYQTLNALGEVDIASWGVEQTATFGGTVTAGDTISLTFTSTGISGSPVTVSYTTGTGNTLQWIANGLQAAIWNNAALRSAGVSALVDVNALSNKLVVTSPITITMTVSSSVSGAATETVSLGSAGSGSSADNKFGMTIIRETHDTAPPGLYSAAIQVGDQLTAPAAGWQNILAVGGEWPLTASGSIISAQVQTTAAGNSRQQPLVPDLATYGIDFSKVDFADQSGASLRMPGFSVSGTGAVSVGNASLSYSATGLSITSPGYVGSGNATVANGGGGGGAGALNANYYVGDLVYDNWGGQHVVTAVNPATGAATTVRTIVQPFDAAGNPGGPLTTTGGTGTGLTLTVNWVAANTIAMGGSGQTVAFGSANQATIDASGNINTSGTITASGGIVGAGATLNSYTANGSYTWTKQAGVHVVCVKEWGAGGAGGSGDGGATSSTRGAGTGGGGGAFINGCFNAADLPATVTVTVGAGGPATTGGSGAAGANGTTGGNTSFGSYLTAYGGGGGLAGGTAVSNTAGGSGGGTAGPGLQGNTSTRAGGAPQPSTFANGIGGGGGTATSGAAGSPAENGGGGGGGWNAGTDAGLAGGGAIMGGGAGGGAGGVSSGNAAGAGAAGGGVATYASGGGGSAGATGGAAGGAGAAGSSTTAGQGGGGGGGNTAGNGGAGGAGGLCGGGGGGGGGGTAAGGNGGAGGDGCVYVWQW